MLLVRIAVFAGFFYGLCVLVQGGEVRWVVTHFDALRF